MTDDGAGLCTVPAMTLNNQQAPITPSTGVRPGAHAATRPHPSPWAPVPGVAPAGATDVGVRRDPERAVVASGRSRGRDVESTETRVARVDPWSVLKVSFLMSLVFTVIGVGACALLYVALDKVGAVASVNDVYNTLVDPADGAATAGPVTLTRTLAATAGLGLAGTVVVTVSATVTAMVFNACVRLAGGVRVTCVESE